jgi:hypothetical protein
VGQAEAEGETEQQEAAPFMNDAEPVGFPQLLVQG